MIMRKSANRYSVVMIFIMNCVVLQIHCMQVTKALASPMAQNLLCRRMRQNLLLPEKFKATYSTNNIEDTFQQKEQKNDSNFSKVDSTTDINALLNWKRVVNLNNEIQNLKRKWALDEDQMRKFLQSGGEIIKLKKAFELTHRETLKIIAMAEKIQEIPRNSTCTYRGLLIHQAVEEGNVKTIECYLNEDVSDKMQAIESKDYYFRTPLHIAAWNGNMEIVKFFLDSGANIHAFDIFKQSPLHLAVCGDHLEIVKYLLNEGADPELKDINGQTPSEMLINKYNELNELQEEYLKNTNKPDKVIIESLSKVGAMFSIFMDFYIKEGKKGKNFSERILFQAIKNGRIEDVTSLFINKRVPLSFNNYKDTTPLLLACEYGHLPIARFLLDRGVDINQRGLFNRGPLDCAISNGNVKLVKYLLKRGAIADYNMFDAAIRSSQGQLDFLKVLVDAGLQVVDAKNYGYTILCTAAEKGYIEIVTFLLEQGVDINERNWSGATPLHEAAKEGHIKVVQLLLDKGAEILLDRKSKTPLALAKDNYHIDAVKLLTLI